MTATFAKLKTLLIFVGGFFAAVGVLSVTHVGPVQASTSPGVNLGTLLTQFYALQATVSSQASQISALQTQNAALQAKTAPLSVSGTTLTITGVNVQIVDGTNNTNSTSGLGNLIIGYNATGNPNGDTRTGSHNLILGDLNSYSSYGGFVAGEANTISGPYGSVSGGNGNTASHLFASVSGGYANTVSGNSASVSGGSGNTASGTYASVSGGNGITQNDTYGWSGASLSGAGTTLTIKGVNVQIIDGTDSTNSTSGLGNLIIGYNALRGSGDTRTGSHNLILGDYNNYSSYGGLVAGEDNAISGGYATVTGGQSNVASGKYASVSGGAQNIASGEFASVSGGGANTASGELTSVSGGTGNTASGYAASVSGGVSVTQNTFAGWSAGSQGGAAYSGKFTSP